MIVVLGMGSLARDRSPARHAHPHSLRDLGKRPFWVGAAHGLAGSGALTLVRDYAELTKLRVTTLIIMTAWCGYYFGALKSGICMPHVALETSPPWSRTSGGVFAQPTAAGCAYRI